jgi:outer membrane protein OmpA-like peptidoglycan-associated protein
VAGATGPTGAPGSAGTPGAKGTWTSFRDILFDFDKSDIRSSEQQKISDVIAFMKQNPNAELTLEGHTDPRGTDAYNMKLSDRRVKTVRDALEKGGVEASRLQIGALGERYRNCTQDTEDCFQKNRRVQVFVR